MTHLARFAALSLVAAAALAGCVQSPTTGTTLSGPYQSTTFTGYAVTANAPVVVEVWNYHTSTWDTLATTTSAPTVSIAQNTIAQNPALYSFSVSAAIATQGNQPSMYHWNYGGPLNNCDYARVKVTAGGWNALTFDSNGSMCINNEIKAGENATNAALDCKSASGEIDMHWTNGPCIF
jgi:hypothetical protein